MSQLAFCFTLPETDSLLQVFCERQTIHHCSKSLVPWFQVCFHNTTQYLRVDGRAPAQRLLLPYVDAEAYRAICDSFISLILFEQYYCSQAKYLPRARKRRGVVAPSPIAVKGIGHEKLRI